jgi:gas vesicle protein
MYTPSTDDPENDLETKAYPEGSPYRNVPNRQSISLLGVGMVAGVAIGAGIALLLAPKSGDEIRKLLGKRMRRLRGEEDVWGKLRREFKRAGNVRRRHELLKRREREEKDLEKERARLDAALSVSP